MSPTQQAPDPVVRTEAMIKLSPHVFVIPDGNVPGVPNVGIVVGNRATLVIDTGMGARNGQLVHDAAQTVGGDRPLRIMTTHVHPEHDLGAHAFPPDCVMVRARTQVSEIEESGLEVADDFRARSPRFAELLEGARFREADIVFDETVTIDLGGVRVQLTAMGPAHTIGDTVALVVEDRVVFTGDLVMTGPPAFASPRSSLAAWLEHLDAIEAMDASVLVPSHGPLGTPDLIDRYRGYLRRVQTLTGALSDAGAGIDEAVRAVRDLVADHYTDEGRVEGAVRVAYREATDATARSGMEET